jgi:hypothetical protein
MSGRPPERAKGSEQERGFNERPEIAEKFFREGRAGQWPRALTQQRIEGYLQRPCADHAKHAPGSVPVIKIRS